jgi:sporulation protein YlmC with PRC-barrel domain
MEITPHLVSTNKLDRYNIVNNMGEDLGQVQNFMLDMNSGEIAFVIVSFGGFMGISDKWFAIPWDAMTWSPESKRFVLNMAKEMLTNAPGLDKRHWQEQVDTRWLAESAEYFGFPVGWHTHVVEAESPVIGIEPPMHKH